MTDVLRLARRAEAIEPTSIRALRSKMGPSTIDFGLGQTDLAVPEAVRLRLRNQFEGPLRAPYTPNAGSPEARGAVADHVGAGPEEVILTCGVQQGLAVAILGLCEPGDQVLVPDPGFPAYANLVRAAKARPVAYPLQGPTAERPGWHLDVGAVEEHIGDDTRLMILNNPSNPTGTLSEPDELAQVLELLHRRGVGWISDEIYEDYVWEGDFVSARRLGYADEGIVLSGLSKSHHLMGWRLGWMVGPADILRGLTPLHQHLVTCAPLPAQQAAIAALADHDGSLAETSRIFGERRRIALEATQGLPLGSTAVAEAAFYLFLDVRPWLSRFDSTEQMALALLDEEDVLVIPGEGFGPAGLGHLRIAYTIGESLLREGLDRLRQFLLRHSPQPMKRGAP